MLDHTIRAFFPDIWHAHTGDTLQAQLPPLPLHTAHSVTCLVLLRRPFHCTRHVVMPRQKCTSEPASVCHCWRAAGIREKCEAP